MIASSYTVGDPQVHLGGGGLLFIKENRTMDVALLFSGQ